MEEYQELLVESYEPEFNSGFHGKVHIRPVENGPMFKRRMHVECSKALSDLSLYPLGSKFILRAKLKKPKKPGDRISIYSSYRLPFKLV